MLECKMLEECWKKEMLEDKIIGRILDGRRNH